jgi:hypothetical protein
MSGFAQETVIRRTLARAAARAGCALMLASCATLARRAGSTDGTETAIFSAVVERLASDAGVRNLRIDPRPLSSNPSIVELTARLAAAAPDFVATPETVLAAVPRSVVEERKNASRRMGVAADDVRAYPDCPGGLASPVAPPTPLDGCPANEYVVAVIGLSRPGGAFLPGSRVDERGQATLGYRSVRVIRREFRPNGATQTAYDFVLAPEPPGSWRIVKIVPLVIAE